MANSYAFQMFKVAILALTFILVSVRVNTACFSRNQTYTDNIGDRKYFRMQQNFTASYEAQNLNKQYMVHNSTKQTKQHVQHSCLTRLGMYNVHGRGGGGFDMIKVKLIIPDNDDSPQVFIPLPQLVPDGDLLHAAAAPGSIKLNQGNLTQSFLVLDETPSIHKEEGEKVTYVGNIDAGNTGCNISARTNP